jgi:hypothetical protein
VRSCLAFLFLASAAGPGPVAAAAADTFYVDQAHGACSDLGPGTESAPFCTITGALSAQHTPGTVLVVQPGLYREQVIVPASGNAANPIVIRAAGPGVTVDGADDVSAASHWAPFVGAVYLAADVGSPPNQVFVDGVRLTPSAAAPADLPPNTFRHVVGEGLYLNLAGDAPSAHQVLVGSRANGFWLPARSYVEVEGFEVVHTEDRGIYVSGAATGSVIRNNRVRFAYKYGIAISQGSAIRVAGNVTTDNQDDGISLVAGATGCTIEDNESARNVHPTERKAQGIELSGASDNLLQRNRMHHNQDSGEHLSAGSANNRSIQNRSWSNEDHGFDRLNSTNTLSIGDVAWGNFRDGFSNEGASAGGRMFNCIAVDNGRTTNRFDLWVDGQSSVGFVSDYNLFWNSSGQAPVKFIATIYPTLAAYVSASGQDLHSTESDPRFAAAAEGDFHLQAGSPAIDAAETGIAEWPEADAEGRPRVDDPGTADTGHGPVTFADRGALEYRPDQAPLVTAPSARAATVGHELAFAVTGVDPDGDPIASLTMSGLPAGAQFDVASDHGSGTLRWTPLPVELGTHVATFTAGNALSGSAATMITVAAANVPPVAALSLTPSDGVAPLTVTADASGSRDRDGGIASYRFDFGDGTIVGPQSSPLADHLYRAGSWTVRATVTDSSGVADSTTGQVEVTAPPSPNLVANPSFEADLSSWAPFLGAVLARVPGGVDGTWAMRVTGFTTAAFGANDSPNSVSSAPAAGLRYRFSARMRSMRYAGTARLRVREYLGQTFLGGAYSSAVPLRTAWQQLTLDWVTTAPGVTLDFQIMDFPRAANEPVLVDDVAIHDVTWSEAVALGSGEARDVAEGEGTPIGVRMHPNPVRDAATLHVTTGNPGPLDVHVFDLGGRRVRRLAERAETPAGTREFDFDGRGDDGAPLAAGVYFYSVRTSEGEYRGRFMIVR